MTTPDSAPRSLFMGTIQLLVGVLVNLLIMIFSLLPDNELSYLSCLMIYDLVLVGLYKFTQHSRSTKPQLTQWTRGFLITSVPFVVYRHLFLIPQDVFDSLFGSSNWLRIPLGIAFILRLLLTGQGV